MNSYSLGHPRPISNGSWIITLPGLWHLSPQLRGAHNARSIGWLVVPTVLYPILLVGWYNGTLYCPILLVTAILVLAALVGSTPGGALENRSIHGSAMLKGRSYGTTNFINYWKTPIFGI